MKMNEIICPACGEKLPVDSRYCDMCGAELLECISCGTPGTDNFCPECGKPMISRKLKPESNENPGSVRERIEESVEESVQEDKTIGGRKKTLVLKARKGNLVIQPRHEAVIGRRGGDYDDLLGSYNLISRRHGKFMQRGCNWYIIDFGSTNGTYVNDTELQPDVPVKFGVGDVIDIATYIFDVIEQ